MTIKYQLTKALELLDRLVSNEMVPDATWYREYFALTGDHMILTEEGWEDGSAKQSYIDDGDGSLILEEVNAPRTDG